MKTTIGPTTIPTDPDKFKTAPDGSQIRLLCDITNGGAAHCTLLKGQVTKAVVHKTIEEIWFFIAGEGQVWQKLEEGKESIYKVSKGTCLTIPLGCHFQFMTVGDDNLEFIIFGTPPWPGEDEAVMVEGKWEAKL